ncbi:MAG: DEAD/DEAH box helicase [Oceanipulchritudo sp.]
MPTKPSHKITLRDKLSRLSYRQACLLLGDEKSGSRLLIEGGKLDLTLDQVRFANNLLRVEFPGARNLHWVEIRLSEGRKGKLDIECDVEGEDALLFKAAVLAFVLEEKTLLGLASLPDDSLPLELLDEKDLVERAITERRERAEKERMHIRSPDKSTPWADYTVTNAESGKSYRVALRGMGEHESYCSCPDFRTNHLGLCKHTLKVKAEVGKRFSKKRLTVPHEQTEFAIHAVYGKELGVRLLVPGNWDHPKLKRFTTKLQKTPLQIVSMLNMCRELEQKGNPVRIYPDAEVFMEQVLHRHRLQKTVARIRKNPARNRLRKELLKVELRPYQLDGIAFAAGAGRAILADDMGLGKTIQGIGVAEFLRRHSGIGRVLVVCPTSLKSQWKLEVERFSDLSVQLVFGSAADRPDQYASDTFFTICNYEQVLRDYLDIERVPWDLIILDEGQRIKNWETKTSRIMKSLRSPFALVLSGTPLENRLEELYSVVQFIDDRRLGPAYRFLHKHRMVNEEGKVMGYRHLDQLREKLAPIMLRRTRDKVVKELPPRTTKVVRIPPTEEQLELHGTHMRIVSSITRKAYVSEMDLLRLQKALLMCRMAANSTCLINKQVPGYSSKLAKVAEMLVDLAEEEDRKIVMFSEWTTMLDRVEPLLRKAGLDFVRLDGKVPQKKRQALIERFKEDGGCRVFLTTNAGSTGINLQAANTVINIDLPWNPAVLEQRIARAHRMGQKRPVQVFLLVTEDTLEENLLNTLSSKNELFLAALDPDAKVEAVALQSGMDELKRRLEVLLGAKEDAPVDESRRQALQEKREQVAESCGRLLSAAFELCGNMLPEKNLSQTQQACANAMKSQLQDCLVPAEDGGVTLTVKLANTDALNRLAEALAGFTPDQYHGQT